MTYFFYAFKLALRSRLQRKHSYVFFAIALVLAVICTLYPVGDKNPIIKVGIVMPVNGAEELFSMMQDRGLDMIEYVPTDPDTMERMIISGEFDCGIIVPEDFLYRITQMDTRRLIIIKTGPASTVYPLIQECISSCVMELMNPYIVEDYLREKNLDSSLMEAAFQKWDMEDSWIGLKMETVNGTSLSSVTLRESGGRRIGLALIAIYTLVWGLYLTVDLGNWLKRPGIMRMGLVRSVSQLLLPQLFASMLPIFGWGILVTVIMGNGVSAVAGYASLVALVTAMGLLLPRYKVLFQSVIAVIPFIVISILLLEPVLFDVRLLFPEISSITCFFPVSLYLSVCDGNWRAMAILTIETVMMVAASLMMDRKKMTK